MLSKGIRTSLVATLLLAIGLGWQANAATDEKEACHAFVQEFYKWYVAKSKAPNQKVSTLETAMKLRKDVFSPELRKRLDEDIAASKKSPGEIVGLDFDPILNSQENIDKCDAGKVTVNNKSFIVDIYEYLDHKRDKEPNVRPELVQNNGKWQFVNFHYMVDKKPDDLLHILKQLREDREKTK